MIHSQKMTHECVVPPEQKMNAGTELQSERSERSVCSVRSGRSGKSETPSETVLVTWGWFYFSPSQIPTLPIFPLKEENNIS